MRVYTNDDVSPKALAGTRVAVIGYGSQGRAHALNLRDSGTDVVVGVRKGGEGWDKAQADGLKTAEPKDAVDGAGIIAILTPDMTHDGIWKDAVEPAIADIAAVLFAHGFS
ncbi:MAG: NAD(P)-binding domain-containing protein, partial [Terriglobia bacterium]